MTALDVARWNMRHPLEPRRTPYVAQCLDDAGGPIVAATDYIAALPDSIARWVATPLISLGTDGFGRSATRDELRDFFEVDAPHIAFAALHGLARDGAVESALVQRAMDELAIDSEKPDPALL